ncbi:hypothetical protein GmHk_07G019676 [Glycine max]|nr:hypothetical protein GmHk_07G019676 [Glycine max]
MHDLNTIYQTSCTCDIIIAMALVRRKLIEDWLPVLVVCKDWLANAVDIGSILDMMNKVAACAKHYVGDDGTTKGINENNIVASYNGLLRIHIGL